MGHHEVPGPVHERSQGFHFGGRKEGAELGPDPLPVVFFQADQQPVQVGIVEVELPSVWQVPGMVNIKF